MLGLVALRQLTRGSLLLILGRGPEALKRFAGVQTVYVQKFKSLEYRIICALKS